MGALNSNEEYNLIHENNLMGIANHNHDIIVCYDYYGKEYNC